MSSFITNDGWAQMKSADIRTVDKNSLVDLNDVVVNEALPISERVADFVSQIRNPYCFRIGEVAVKVVYKSEGPTFQQNMEDLLRTM